VADTVLDLSRRATVAASTNAPRHHAMVRATHWVTTLACVALLVSGVELVISHPRFYWGENGNVLTPALFSFPIPSSRATVPTGYGYVLPDQNGWSRYLHFEAAWILVLIGGLYLVFGLVSGHFRKGLFPRAADRSWSAVSRSLRDHLRLTRPEEEEAWSYNVLQRLTYLGVVFVVFPLFIWTGLAMSPAVTAAMPTVVTVFGGRQSARTLHFLLTLLLVLFVLIHVGMVWLAGFRRRVTAMITGNASGHRKSV